MTKTILVIIIASTLVLGISIPFADAISWPGLLREVGLPMEPEVITRSGQFLVPAGETSEDPNAIIVTCEPDEIFLSHSVFMFVDPPDFTGMAPDLNADNVDDGNTPFINNANGWRVLILTPADVDRTIDISIGCVRPSLLSTIVGGEWQATDTTALLIGYTVLNSYWIAPTIVGIGMGLYITRNKWNRKN